MAYRSIDSFQEYLLIDQYRIHVEHCVRTAANQWLLAEYNDPTVVLNFNAFEFQFKIADLYENIDLSNPSLAQMA